METPAQPIPPSHRPDTTSRHTLDMDPETFRALGEEARALGFPAVYSGVFVRSSFHAGEVYRHGGPR